MERALAYVAEHIQGMLSNISTVSFLAAKGQEAFYCDIAQEGNINTTPLDSIWRVGQQIDVVERLYLASEGDLTRTLDVEVNSMSLDDMTDFAKHIINTQVEYNYFARRVPTIGGPVQICMLSKDGKVSG